MALYCNTLYCQYQYKTVNLELVGRNKEIMRAMCFDSLSLKLCIHQIYTLTGNGPEGIP